ncbi:GNAT family N-acetyltransferase [Levilactobacillus namurensis]|uniref:GNAT family N-acetyltransferase n=1 Tax=Levilactobacillus namurensis TaxID=380393 RepID=A0AAW8W4P3_9LACO|nr:GNAT family N-acetyltransferase [Levilactobacillus namurensis]MDT7013749.1 GNAT family N-acetyltransferase [Levilactobacillus namurensis]
MYVHYAHQGRGIARSLVRTLEEQVAANRYQTYASITARPFFEREGYRLIRETVVERAGVNLLNFEMQKN